MEPIILLPDLFNLIALHPVPSADLTGKLECVSKAFRGLTESLGLWKDACKQHPLLLNKIYLINPKEVIREHIALTLEQYKLWCPKELLPEGSAFSQYCCIHELIKTALAGSALFTEIKNHGGPTSSNSKLAPLTLSDEYLLECVFKSPRILQMLLDHGIKPTTFALYMAMKTECPLSCIELLLDAGAKPNYHVLHQATKLGNKYTLLFMNRA